MNTLWTAHREHNRHPPLELPPPAARVPKALALGEMRNVKRALAAQAARLVDGPLSPDELSDPRERVKHAKVRYALPLTQLTWRGCRRRATNTRDLCTPPITAICVKPLRRGSTQ